MLNEKQTQRSHPLIHSLVHPQGQNCKGKSLKDRSWQQAEKNVTSWKSGRDEPCSRSVCVCVFLQTVSSLGVYSSCTSCTFTSLHLLTLLPESQHHGVLLNPSSHFRFKAFFASFSIFTFFFQGLPSQISASVYSFSACTQRKKRVFFALSICHSSLVPLSLKRFDSITISI